MCPRSRVLHLLSRLILDQVLVPNDVGAPCKPSSQKQQLTSAKKCSKIWQEKNKKGNKVLWNWISWTNHLWRIDNTINQIHFHVLTKWEQGEQINQQTAAVGSWHTTSLWWNAQWRKMAPWEGLFFCAASSWCGCHTSLLQTPLSSFLLEGDIAVISATQKVKKKYLPMFMLPSKWSSAWVQCHSSQIVFFQVLSSLENRVFVVQWNCT